MHYNVDHTDNYRKALMELIEEKKVGNRIVSATDKPIEVHSNVTDLMTALQASLDKTKKKKPLPKKRAAKAKTS